MMEAIDLHSFVCREARQLLGRGAVCCLLVDSWCLDASRLTALLFARGETRPRLVAKVGRREGQDQVATEHRNLGLLARSTEEDFCRTVPRSYGLSRTPEVALLLESVVPGKPLQLPLDRTSLDRFADRVEGWLLAFHRAAGAERGPMEDRLHQRIFLRPFAAYRRSFEPDGKEEDFIDRMERMAESLRGEPFPTVYAHGDLCPSNILIEGGSLGVIDWDQPFAPTAAAFDLIHLFACLGVSGGALAGLRPFERTFFEENPLSAVVRRSLQRYVRALGIPTELLRLLFTLFWIEYALEKIEAVRRSPGLIGASGGGAAWSLARFDESTCLNIRYMSRHEDRLVLP